MNKIIRVAVITTFGMCITGCSGRNGSGIFVAQSPSEVDMLDIVEAPAGHLSGTIVIAAIDKSGERTADVIRNISGNLYQNNVSLKIGNDEMFAHSTGAVGALRGRDLHLDTGGTAQVFRRMTRREYSAALAALDQNGANRKKVQAALKSATDLDGYMSNLDATLAAFLMWGESRIERVSGVRAWYTSRISHYQQCINAVKPLASWNVPSWKWQTCVIAMDNDEYVRQQMSTELTDLQKEELAGEQNVNGQLAVIPQRISEVVNLVAQACSTVTSEKACKAQLQKLENETPSPSIKLHVSQYKAMLPRLRNAIGQDLQVGSDGENELSVLVSEGNSLLRRK